jgi:hypothetical protein
MVKIKFGFSLNCSLRSDVRILHENKVFATAIISIFHFVNLRYIGNLVVMHKYKAIIIS